MFLCPCCHQRSLRFLNVAIIYWRPRTVELLIDGQAVVCLNCSLVSQLIPDTGDLTDLDTTVAALAQAATLPQPTTRLIRGES